MGGGPATARAGLLAATILAGGVARLAAAQQAEPPASPETPAFRPNAVFVELLGTGFLLSVQYQRNFLLAGEDHLSLAGGLGVALDQADAFVPLTLSWNHGRSWHFLELGAGYTHRVAPGETSFVHAVVGARLQTRTGFLVKIRLTPLVPVSNWDVDDLPVLPWAGLALGALF